MERQKILNLLYEVNDSKFVTRKWNIVNDNSNANYGVGIEIISTTKFLKFNLCDYSHAYILIKGVTAVAVATKTQVALSFIYMMKQQ